MNIIRTSTTAAVPMSHWDNEYELSDNDISPTKIANEKREFKQWLSSSGYEGRWRSTENYRSLSHRDQTTFRTQVKAIFRHVLNQLAPNDVDIVWEDLVDDEVRKPTNTNDG
jgi:hypothetical protein